MNKNGQFVSSDEAVHTDKQHHSPCADCPWGRKSISGWLGGHTREEWLAMAHGEARMECHTLIPAQCAGAAIYRTNVCKSPKDPSHLRLPHDRERVFASPAEFLEHHDLSNFKEKVKP